MSLPIGKWAEFGIVEKIVGKKVICRSNEDDPLTVGEIVSIEEMGGTKIPYVRCEDTGKLWGIMGVMIPYHEDIYQTLSKWTPAEQWGYMAGMSLLIKTLR